MIHWFNHDLNVNIYDQYGQTELGMVIANHHALEHEKESRFAGLLTRVIVLWSLNQTNEEVEKAVLVPWLLIFRNHL